MCLLYSILYGCEGPCGRNKGGCGCRGGANGGLAAAEAASVGCSSQNPQCGCCRSRACCGFGSRGGFSVCCDAAYYCRQYALCSRCCEDNCNNCSRCNNCNGCGNCGCSGSDLF